MSTQTKIIDEEFIDAGKVAGLTIWRIENFKCVKTQKKDHGLILNKITNNQKYLCFLFLYFSKVHFLLAILILYYMLVNNIFYFYYHIKVKFRLLT